MKLNLSTLTMNAEGILFKQLKECSSIFDNILICDGKLTHESSIVYQKLQPKHKTIFFDLPWDDDYVARYRKNSEKTSDGDWILHLDDDELLSEELKQFLIERKFIENVNMYCLPCILHITEDGKKYYPVEPKPDERFFGQWTKQILYRKNDKLNFRYFGSHVVPENMPKMYLPLPYYHMKSLESFVYNDVWQAFLHPQGQGYSDVETAKFKMFTRQYKNTDEFKKATLSGSWSFPLAKFAYDHIQEYNRPISRLGWVYFILQNNSFPNRPIPTWNEVKQYVLSKESMLLLEQNKQKGNFLEL